MLVCKHAKELINNYKLVAEALPDNRPVDITKLVPQILAQLNEPCDCIDTFAETISKKLKNTLIL